MANSQFITFSNFMGGVNEQVDKSLLSINEASKLQNFLVKDGTLKTTNGSTLKVTLPASVKTLMKYYNGQVGHLYAVENNTIQEITGATAQIKSGLTGMDFDYINYDINGSDVMILCNAADNTQVYNGSTFRNLLNRRPVYTNGTITSYIDANGVSHATEATITTLAPKGKFIELHYERLWMAGVASTPNSVYFSSATSKGFDPDDWTYPLDEGEANQHGGVIDIPTWDGGVIIGLKVLFNDILIFKNKNIFRIYGTYPGNYQKEQLFSTNGAIADKSIVCTNNKALFVASEGIFAFDGVNTTKISDKIQKTWDTLNKSYLSKSVAMYSKGKYILAVPEGVSTVNNLVIEYDTQLNNFVFKRGMTINSLIEFNDIVYYADDSGNVLIYESGTTNNGTAISSIYESGDIDMGAKSALKTLEMVYFIGSGNGDIKISCTTEKGTKELVVTLNSTETLYKKRFSPKGRILKFKIENVNGSQITIKSPQFLMEYDYD